MGESPTRTIGSDVVVVAPTGKLNMMVAPELRQQLHSLVESGNTRLVVDLGDVAFVDSSGLGALISGLKVARQAGGDLRIAAPAEQVRSVLELTNLDRVLNAYDSAEDAFDEPD
jgi:anti-anti-sigma factor